MRTRRSTMTLALAVIATGLAACEDGTGIESVEDQMTIDAAMLAADATLEEVAMFREPVGFRGMHIPGVDDVPEHRRRPGRPGGPGSFQGELSGTRAVSFFDAAGVEQEEYDEATTASVHIIHDVEGSVERERFSAEISRERDPARAPLRRPPRHRREPEGLRSRPGSRDPGLHAGAHRVLRALTCTSRNVR